MHGHQDMVQVLLGQGAELNAKDKGGWLPLHYAAKSGYLNTVKLLVDNGMTIFVFIINQAFEAFFVIGTPTTAQTLEGFIPLWWVLFLV